MAGPITDIQKLFCVALAVILCLWNINSCQAMPNKPKLGLSGDGEHGDVVAGGVMHLDCEHKVDIVDRVVWKHIADGVETVVAAYNDTSQTDCGLGDYASRAQCGALSEPGDQGHRLTLSAVEYPGDQAEYTCTVVDSEDPGVEEVSNPPDQAAVHVELLIQDTELTPPVDPTASSVELMCSGGHAKPVGDVTWAHNGKDKNGTDVESCDSDDGEFCNITSTLTLIDHMPGDEVVCTIGQARPFMGKDPLEHQYVFPSEGTTTSSENPSTEGGGSGGSGQLCHTAVLIWMWLVCYYSALN